MKKSNPYVQAAYLEAVDNQLRNNDPPETRETFDRLIAEGFSSGDAKLMIAQVICYESYYILKHQEKFNLKRFVQNLKRLPEEPKER
jgi:uncharacterized protein YoaH (UPF0181 family)